MPAVILVELLQCQNLACNGTVQQPSNSETYEKGPRYNQNLNRAKIFCSPLGTARAVGVTPNISGYKRCQKKFLNKRGDHYIKKGLLFK